MGVVSSIGDTLATMTNSLKSGCVGIRKVENSDLPVKIAASLDDFDIHQKLSELDLPLELLRRAEKMVHRSSRVLQTAVYCVLYAWKNAQMDKFPPQTQRTGIIIAGQNLNSRLYFDHYKKYIDDLDYVPASFGLQFMDTDLVGAISSILQVQGPGFTIGGASASGNVGIIQAHQLLQCGIIDHCLVIGAMADLSPIELQAWKNMGALGGKTFKAHQSCRPFDKAREGFIYGQGCGCLVLEKLSHLGRRKQRQLTAVSGTSLTLDGNRQADPSSIGEARAMRQALDNAALNPSDIDYINTHGTSSVLGDEAEIKAIKTVFHGHIDRIWINATKGLIGHCLYAAGVIETIATVLQMQNGFVHPNKNCNNPIDSEANFVGDTVERADISHAISNSFGFGGINSSIVLSTLN